MIAGYYYLHVNGSLIYERALDGGVAADIRESPFAVVMWSIDPTNRENVWSILIEALSIMPLSDGRIRGLAEKWGCDDEDAQIYAEGVGCLLRWEDDHWIASRKDFIDEHTSLYGAGSTALEAMAALCKLLGYKGGKTGWHATFKDLLKIGLKQNDSELIQ
jgi:hypothetical protein